MQRPRQGPLTLRIFCGLCTMRTRSIRLCASNVNLVRFCAHKLQGAATLPIQTLTRVKLHHCSLKLNHCSFTAGNQHVKISSALLTSAPSVDHLSPALHTLSQSPNLTCLYLEGTIVLHPCFFRPRNHADPTFFRPRLQDLMVELSITTYENNRLYKRGPGDTEYFGKYGEEYLDPPTLPNLFELENLLTVQPGNERLMHLSRPEVPHSFENERLQSMLNNINFRLFHQERPPGETSPTT